MSHETVLSSSYFPLPISKPLFPNEEAILHCFHTLLREPYFIHTYLYSFIDLTISSPHVSPDEAKNDLY